MRNMIQFTPADFRPLNTFELAWRWTQPKWSVLPEAALAQIHPLTEAKAHELWDDALSRAQELYPSLFDQHTSNPLIHFTAASLRLIDAAPANEVVRAQLQLLPIPEAQEMVVMWDADLAVTVPWHIFRDFWDDFCYPSSDDVFVWPPSREWFLFYFHEQQFLFAQTQSLDDRSSAR